MNATLGPGTYIIKLNDFGKPSLYTSEGAHLDHPRFETTGDSRFHFEILNVSDIPDSLIFSEPPISWSDGEEPLGTPLGNSHHVEGNILTLDVRLPVLDPLTVTYHFTLYLNRGDITEVLWTSDGVRPLDPTIIEKPPE
jgi:hypothetical protein